MWKTKFSSHKQYYLVSSSLEMERRLIQTKVYYNHFYYMSETKRVTNLWIYQLQKSLSQVCTSLQLASTNALFYVITRRHCFIQVSRYLKVYTIPMFLHSLKQVFWKKTAFYICYIRLITSLMLLMRKV